MNALTVRPVGPERDPDGDHDADVDSGCRAGAVFAVALHAPVDQVPVSTSGGRRF